MNSLFRYSFSIPITTPVSSVVQWLRTRFSGKQRRIRKNIQLHPYGYCYVPLLCNRFLEVLILQWPAGAESKPHNHGCSINFTKISAGQVLERKYYISGGELRVVSERILQAGQWAWTLPFEIHELVALNTSAETFHLYFPGRIY